MKSMAQFNRDRGFTILELLLAMTISLGMIGGVLLLYANSHHSSRTQSLNRQVQENGRFSLQFLGEEFRMAEYWGMNIIPTSIDTSEVDTVDIGCGATGWIARIEQPIFSSNNTNPYSANCIPAENYQSNTDVIVVRRVESNPVANADIKQGYIYLYTSLTQGTLFKADADDSVDAATVASVTEIPASAYQLSTNVYYIRPCRDTSRGSDEDICDSGDDQVPTLVRETVGANTTVTEVLVENIENMQLSFGIDLTVPADYIADRFVSANNVTNWDKVTAIRLELLARSPEAVVGYDASKTYNIGDITLTKEDGIYRKVYSSTFMLRNPRFNTDQI